MRGPWLRDLPLLLGIAASAVVIASSTLVSGPPPPSPQSAPAVPQNAILGGNKASAEAPRKAAQPRKRDAGKPSHRKKSVSGGATATPKPAATPKARATPKATATPRATAAPKPSATPERTATVTPTPTPPLAPRGPVQVKGTKAQVLAGSVTFTMSATTHAPKVGSGWTLEAGATRNGRALPGRVRADAFFQGAPVYDIDTGRLKAGRYRYHDVWPQRAAGVPLTIRLRVNAGGRQQVFLFDLRVAGEAAPVAP